MSVNTAWSNVFINCLKALIKDQFTQENTSVFEVWQTLSHIVNIWCYHGPGRISLIMELSIIRSMLLTRVAYACQQQGRVTP